MERSPCFWIGRINIVKKKLAILLKAIYRFNATPTKIPTHSFTDFERMILNFIWKIKKPRIAKTILYYKGTSGDITILDIRATVIKQLDIGIKTETLTNGIKLKTRILIHTFMNT